MRDLPNEPFLWTDLETLGLSRADLDDVLALGLVRRVLTGVYCRADLPDTIDLRAKCAALVLPEHAVVSDRSAAWLHGIDCYDMADLEVPPLLEVVSTNGNDRVRRPQTLGGKRALLREDTCELNAVLATTPLRTACDVACLRGRNTALAVLDAFRRKHGLTLDDFNRILPRYGGRRGVQQLRELIPLSSPKPESPPESWTRMTIIDAGFHPPKPQVWVYVPGFGWVRLDMAYQHLKIAIEYDGEEFHTSDEDKEADRNRREALGRDGWVVIVVTRSDLSPDAREAWLQGLRDSVDARTRPGRRVYARGESWGPRRRRR